MVNENIFSIGKEAVNSLLINNPEFNCSKRKSLFSKLIDRLM